MTLRPGRLTGWQIDRFRVDGGNLRVEVGVKPLKSRMGARVVEERAPTEVVLGALYEHRSLGPAEALARIQVISRNLRPPATFTISDRMDNHRTMTQGEIQADYRQVSEPVPLPWKE